ncbi:hypothetical protein BJY04DRAFT_186767 [Aspergillus karnatakaensis]|uniref:uncharacterized protein n=1 Tax=Aspergillus karnatakaensis TaxID=1810916 RepID=UPI003CCE4236
MTLRAIWACAVLAIGVFPISGLARECTGWFDIFELEDIERYFSGCTTVNGTIAILPSFSGALDLADIIDITGTIKIDLAADVSSVEAPELVSVGSLEFELGQAEPVVSFPLLHTVEENVLIIGAGTVELPSLTSAGSISLKGAFESIELNALLFVGGAMTIHNADSSLDAVEISLPALEFAESIKLSGAISSISFPSISSIPTEITVRSTHTLDCEGLANAMMLSASQPVSCTSPPVPASPSKPAELRRRALQRRATRMQNPAIIALIIVPIVFVLLMMTCCTGGSKDSDSAIATARAAGAANAAAAANARTGNTNININVGVRRNANSGNRGVDNEITVPLPVYPGYQNHDGENWGAPPRYSFTDERGRRV